MKTILVCDDEKHMLRLLEFSLKKSGARILTASSGDEALQCLVRENVDLLILDVMMPGKDGFETIRALRANPAVVAPPVIMLTARGQTTTREEATALGVSAFLTKPFSPLELQKIATQLLG
jgi:DNA-binding response OmpR family regulator